MIEYNKIILKIHLLKVRDDLAKELITQKQETPEEREKILKKIRKSRLMDDAYMKIFFDGELECTQLVLRIIMGQDDLIVISSQAQKDFEGASGKHSIRLDIYAIDSEGRHYDIEIQRKSSGAVPQRARFCSALLDANMLNKNQPYKDLRTSVVIFITERDVLRGKKPIYKIERYIDGERLFKDGSKIIYVNTKHQDANTALGKLMHDFMCVKADEMFYDTLASRTRTLKENKEGEDRMKSVWDEMEKEKLAEGKKEGRQEERESIVLKMLKDGYLAFEKIAEYSGFSVSQVQELAKTLA